MTTFMSVFFIRSKIVLKQLNFKSKKRKKKTMFKKTWKGHGKTATNKTEGHYINT